MITKQEALKYLEQAIRNDKQFAVIMLAELIYKNCIPSKLEEAVVQWRDLGTASDKPEADKPNPVQPPPQTRGPKLETEWER